MDSCLDLISPAAARKDLEICSGVEEEYAEYAVGDVTRSRQVLSNLLSNAVKFTERGETEVRVDVVRPASDDLPDLRVRVRDTGIGMSVSQQRLIFAPFTQADASTPRRFGGTGLGLAISRRLAERMGGTILVESASGSGSLFTFRVPLRSDLAAAGTTATPAGPLAGMAVVDDHDTNRRYLSRQLAKWGVEARTFASAEDFLVCVRAGYHPESVLMTAGRPSGLSAPSRRNRASHGSSP